MAPRVGRRGAAGRDRALLALTCAWASSLWFCSSQGHRHCTGMETEMMVWRARCVYFLISHPSLYGRPSPNTHQPNTALYSLPGGSLFSACGSTTYPLGHRLYGSGVFGVPSRLSFLSFFYQLFCPALRCHTNGAGTWGRRSFVPYCSHHDDTRTLPGWGCIL